MYAALRNFLTLLCLLALSLKAEAQERFLPLPSSEAQPIVSILTCAPGAEVFELEGHSALRLQYDGFDLTVNWGLFDFNSPNFIYRFVKGETDYSTGACHTRQFLMHYAMEGRRVDEYVINLDREQALRLVELLNDNLQPANRTYRYNYLFDNCATRPYEIISQATGRDLPLCDLEDTTTFREEMRRFHHNYPWYQFGIDLCLGSGIDRPISSRDAIFAPVNLTNLLTYASSSMVCSINNPIKGSAAGTSSGPTPWILSPMAAMCALLALSIIVSVISRKHRTIMRIFSSLLFLVFGLAGCIIAFLVFISSHEATSPNWILIWLNPLCLIIPTLLWVRKCREFVRIYCIAFSLASTTLIVIGITGIQNLNPAFYPAILAGIITSLALTNRSHRKNKSSAKTSTKGRFSTIALIVLAALPCAAQPNIRRSPLVICITVEGLSDNYLSLLEPLMTERGFRRLIRGGITISNLDYGPGADRLSSAAILHTGASPLVNGIPGEQVYNPTTKHAPQTLSDAAYIGNFTDETYSPAPIKVSTLADELRIDSDGEGLVYSLGANPQNAIAGAGHAANGAYWIWDRTGNWASTTYYRKDLPPAVTNRNYRTPLHSRLDTVKWTPVIDIKRYPLLSKTESSTPFRHTYPAKDPDRFIEFKASPYVNTEITDLALEIMNASRLGADEAPDMIALEYTVAPENGRRPEAMDMYLRLDRDLARLFDAADKAAGIGNTTILLAGVPTTRTAAPDDKKWRVPTGEYSIRKALSLLGVYLMATHGNGDWITGYHNRQFFLNRKLITDRNLNLAAFRTEVADFLARMAGVSNVYTIDDVIASRAGHDPQALKRSLSVEHAGDVFIEINPGWVITDSGSGISRTEAPQVVRNNAVRIPAFIAGPGVAARRIDTPVDARVIAPTIARIVNVRPPNGASLPSLPIE